METDATADSDADAIAVTVGDRLRERAETLAVAESCTGGLIGSLITDVPGASDYFDRGYITYAYGAKLAELAVPREILDEQGAVSAPTAKAMARGARDRADTTWGIATTGIAGPSGGTPDTPVGTVFIGIAYAAPWESGGSDVSVSRYVFDGSRTEIKHQIAEQALQDLQRAIVDRSNSA